MRTSRFIACVAVLVVLWKLGDDACGCAAHNDWVEAFAGSSHSHDSDAAEHGHGQRPYVDHACEAAGCPVFLLADAVELPDDGLVTRLAGAEGTAVPLAWNTRRESALHAAPRVSAARLRAALQILLI